jgi:hypothetical protein
MPPQEVANNVRDWANAPPPMPIIENARARFFRRHSFGEFIFSFHWSKRNVGEERGLASKVLASAPCSRAGPVVPTDEVQRCNAGEIFHEADDRELAFLNGFDFQPGFGALRTIQRISPFGNYALKV